MAIRVLISRDPAAPFDASWERVGTLEPSACSDNQAIVRTMHKQPGGGQKRFSFYLSGDPDSPWVRAADDHESFAIAFDLFDDGTRVLVSTGPASVRSLATRPPEPHPGLKVVPIYLGIRVNTELRPPG